MFIIKLGAEALHRLEEQLTVNSNQKEEGQKSIHRNNLYSLESKPESSILYNLLSCNEGASSKSQSLLYPDYFKLKIEKNLPPRANTISFSNQNYYEESNVAPRPYSAPQSIQESHIQKARKRKQSELDDFKLIGYNKNCKTSYLPNSNSPSMSCSTDSFSDEPMDLSRSSDNNNKSLVSEDRKFVVDSWLIKVVTLINSTNKQFNSSLIELPPNIRLHLLQASWHRIIVTYLFEFLTKLPGSFSEELWKFVQSITGTTNQSVLTKKNMSYMYKNLIDDLNTILYQIRKLNLNNVSMNYLRIGMLLTGNHDENSKKNLKLIELFIQSKTDSSESDLYIIRDLVDNLLKLNSVIVETIFYGHLNDNVETVIGQLFANT